MDTDGCLLFAHEEQMLRQPRIPFSDQDHSLTGSIKTMPPSRPALDGQGALMITAMKMTVGPHVLSTRERITQIPLRNDLDRPVMPCRNVYHLVYEAVYSLINSS
jgi:hypothetical protein